MKTQAPIKDPRLRDFRNFLYLVWKFVNLPDPTPIQYDLSGFLQNGPRRKIIMAFRGVGKSWVTAAYVCWLLYWDYNKRLLVVSANKDRADQFSTFTKRLIMEMPELSHLKPGRDQRSSNVAFDVGLSAPDQAPSVKSVGIFGQLTGSRADEIVADDIEIPNNSDTQGMRDKLRERVKEFDAVLKPGGKVTYLGTPQTEDSIYNELTERGYDLKVWPARMPGEKTIGNYGSRLAEIIRDGGFKAGRTTDPLRFTDEDLAERELSYGRAGFNLQFMLDTRLSDADKFPLKLKDLIVFSVDPDIAPGKFVWAADPSLVLPDLPNVGMRGDRYHRPLSIDLDNMMPYTGSVMAIDPSGRGKDETGYAVIKFLNGYLFVVEAGGLTGGYDKETVLEPLAKMAKKHGVKKIVVESNFGDGMFTQLFHPVLGEIEYRVAVEDVRHSTQKERRIIDTLEPVITGHKLIIDPKVIEQDYETVQQKEGERKQNYSLFYQMTRITKERGALAHDDRLDALSMAVAYWTLQMAKDADKAIDKHKEKLLEDELKKFMASFGRSSPKKTGWVKV